MARSGRGRVERQIDDLFRLPLDRFTAARNALASKVEQGERIRELRKPGVPAWVVNQLYWTRRRELNRLLRAGDRVRRAQQSGGGAARLQAAGRERREALSSLMTHAESILVDAGHASSPGTLRRVTSTLEALAAGVHPSPAGGPGRLQEDLEPPGFEALQGAVPARPGKARKTRDAAVERRRKAEDAAVREAERELARQRRAAERAEASLRGAEKAAHSAAGALEEARDRLAAAERAHRRAGADLYRARERGREAVASVSRAEKKLEKVRRIAGRGRRE